jgi:hypothetical protein
MAVPTDSPPADLGPMVHCPGCGGRNLSGATECDWCGRQFISPGRRLRITFWQLLSTLAILAILVAVGALVLLNAGRSLPPPRVAPQPTVQVVSSAAPTPAVTPRVTSPPTAEPSPTVAPTPTSAAVAAPPEPTQPPEPTATPEPQTAVIANTGGQGVMVRAEAGPQAAAVGALREGTAVTLTGQEQTVATRTWREIETPDHRLKGWVLDDFLQT